MLASLIIAFIVLSHDREKKNFVIAALQITFRSKRIVCVFYVLLSALRKDFTTPKKAIALYGTCRPKTVVN